MRFSQLCWWICQPCELPYAYHHGSLLPLSSGQFKKSTILGLPWSWMLQTPPKQSHLHTKLHCTVSQKTGIVCLSHGIRINSGFNQKNAGVYLTGFNFFIPTLTQRKQKPKENCNRAIQEGQKLVYAYEVCSKKDRTFAIKTLLLILQHFKHRPPQSSPLYWQYTVPNVFSFLECLLERTFCDGAQFSCRIFLNLLYGLEKTSFQSGFKLGKQEKVCWG